MKCKKLFKFSKFQYLEIKNIFDNINLISNSNKLNNPYLLEINNLKKFLNNNSNIQLLFLI